MRGLGTAGGFKLLVEDRAGRGFPALQQATDEFSTRAPAARLTPREQRTLERSQAKIDKINVKLSSAKGLTKEEARVAAKAGLIDPATRVDLLSNTLVIIEPKDGQGELAPAALAETAIKHLALADPRSVPAGVYAREYLTKLGVWNAVEPRVVPTENVRAALAAVESGNVEAGIVYKTDAAISKAVKIAYEVSATEGPKILYPVAVMKDSKNADASKKFVEYLKSGPALAVFEKFGFIVRP